MEIEKRTYVNVEYELSCKAKHAHSTGMFPLPLPTKWKPNRLLIISIFVATVAGGLTGEVLRRFHFKLNDVSLIDSTGAASLRLLRVALVPFIAITILTGTSRLHGFKLET